MGVFLGAALLGGAAISAVGQNQAAKTEANAQNNASNMQMQMFNTLNQNQQPFMQSGYNSQQTLNQLMGLGTASGGGTAGNTVLPNGYLTSQFQPTQAQLNAYPGYQYALNQGSQAVANQDTPTQGALSGATVKDLMNFNQGMASQNYGTYFNQYQQQQNNIFNRLSSIAGLGQNAAANVGNQGTQLAGNAGQATAAAGASLAGGQIGVSNALSGSAVPLAYLLNNGAGTSLSGGVATGAGALSGSDQSAISAANGYGGGV